MLPVARVADAVPSTANSSPNGSRTAPGMRERAGHHRLGRMNVITVHRLADDARRVTVRQPGGEVDLGRVYNDDDLAETLRRAGLDDVEEVLADPAAVRWEGEGPHVWGSERPRPPGGHPGGH